MKKVFFALVSLLALAACNSSNAAEADMNNGDALQGVAFQIAKNYFFKNDQKIPANPKITTEEEFNKLFGMATTMGKDGMPTDIDFSKSYMTMFISLNCFTDCFFNFIFFEILKETFSNN